ncbi:alpha/beta hydrolase [Rhodobacteraceae bacterium NNCM2]|nr:alpha/beta hydrolase [Coraliihabitans acroporae]
MAVIRVNATRDGTLEHGSTDRCWQQELDSALERLPRHAPICILIHGYRFTWRRRSTPIDPQDRLYGVGQSACTGARPERADWAGHLGFGAGHAAAGLCIGFGWEARSTGSGGRLRTFSRIYRDAAVTGEALARLIGHVTARRPDAEVDIVAHSLGARVALQALPQARDHAVGRLILMGAAEYAGEARNALVTHPEATVYHLMSRANDPFDGLFGHFAPPPARAGDRSLGWNGLQRTHPRWLDIQLDLPEMRGWLAARGHRLTRNEPISHWHFYADPGAMSFYRSILRQRPPHAIGALLADGLPDRIEPRWSRLRPPLPRLRRGGGFGPTAAPLPSGG